MEPENLLPSIVWRGKYSGNLDLIKKRIYSYIESKPYSMTNLYGNCIQSSAADEPPHEWEELTDFNNWFADAYMEPWKNWNYELTDNIVPKSWFTYYPKEAYAGAHTHNMVSLICIFYVNAPSGNLEIQNPLFYHWEGTPRRNGLEWLEIPVNTGDVIMIPGWVNHRTKPNESDDNRMIITINLYAH